MLPAPQMPVQQDADCTGGSTHTSSHCKALEYLADYIFRAKDPASRVQYASIIKLGQSSHDIKPALECRLASPCFGAKKAIFGQAARPQFTRCPPEACGRGHLSTTQQSRIRGLAPQAGSSQRAVYHNHTAKGARLSLQCLSRARKMLERRKGPGQASLTLATMARPASPRGMLQVCRSMSQDDQEHCACASSMTCSQPCAGSLSVRHAAGADAEAKEQPQPARKGRRNTKKPANAATRGRNADLQVRTAPGGARGLACRSVLTVSWFVPS